jgi:hypothetical protein
VDDHAALFGHLYLPVLHRFQLAGAQRDALADVEAVAVLALHGALLVPTTGAVSSADCVPTPDEAF